jgi:hypothetical protein
MRKIVGSSVIAVTAGLAVIAANGDMAAQEGRTNDRDATAAQNVGTKDDRFNYGILGLAGLGGLLGLMPRDRRGGKGITVRDGDGNLRDTPHR